MSQYLSYLDLLFHLCSSISSNLWFLIWLQVLLKLLPHFLASQKFFSQNWVNIHHFLKTVVNIPHLVVFHQPTSIEIFLPTLQLNLLLSKSTTFILLNPMATSLSSSSKSLYSIKQFITILFSKSSLHLFSMTSLYFGFLLCYITSLPQVSFLALPLLIECPSLVPGMLAH